MPSKQLNPAWKTAIPGYRVLHYWVERIKGKPNFCEICKSDSKKTYQWANISGEYKKEVSDWRRLCASCHARENHPGHCINGHELTTENIYIKPNGFTECRLCRSSRRKKEKLIRKLRYGNPPTPINKGMNEG